MVPSNFKNKILAICAILRALDSKGLNYSTVTEVAHKALLFNLPITESVRFERLSLINANR